jgi:hypothetical protein
VLFVLAELREIGGCYPPSPTEPQAKPRAQGIDRPRTSKSRFHRRVQRHPSGEEIDHSCVQAQSIASIPLVARGEEEVNGGDRRLVTSRETEAEARA